MGSRGSVIPFFIDEAKTGRIPITDKRMTRFNISLEEGVNTVKWVALNGKGGDIFVPKIPSYRITDLAEAIGPNCEKIIIGIRAGEKIHEEMVTQSDSYNTLDIGQYYVISSNKEKSKEFYTRKNLEVKSVNNGFTYNSGQNEAFLTIDEIRKLIRENLNSDFEPK